MAAIRVLFLATVGLSLLALLLQARWEARLRSEEQTWMIDLGQHPVWKPPDAPGYHQFRQHFESLTIKPDAGTTIGRVFKLDWMLLDFLLCLWGVAAAFGAVYVFVRGRRRDLILHTALCLSAGVTASAAACLGLWLALGGWGPPAPEVFGLSGVALGGLLTIVTYPR
jgi:hypothetical protein